MSLLQHTCRGCRAANWLSSVLLLLVPLWPLMRQPLHDRAEPRRHVTNIMLEITGVCRQLEAAATLAFHPGSWGADLALPAAGWCDWPQGVLW